MTVFPQEILDRILLLCDVRVAIALRNEHVKRKLLPWVRIHNRKDQCPKRLEWIENYSVGSKAQLSFFRTVYRRHTNFAMESMEQTFTGGADFARKVSCLIARNGDLVRQSPDLPMLQKNVE